MFVYIILLWILIKLAAPAWLYILLALAGLCKFISALIEAQNN